MRNDHVQCDQGSFQEDQILLHVLIPTTKKVFGIHINLIHELKYCSPPLLFNYFVFALTDMEVFL